MAGPAAPRRALWVLPPALLAAAVYLPSLRVGFLLDDFILAGHYHRLSLGGALREFVTPWLGTKGYNFYRPLVTLLGFAEVRLWGTRAWAWHVTNVLLHAGSTAFLSLLLLRCLGPGAALLGGGWFALHALHAESVCWVSGRTDLLAAFWFLAACLLFLSPRRGALAAAWAAAAAALAAKEAAMPLPLVLLLLHVYVRPPGRRLRHHLPFWLLFGGYLALRWHLFGKFIPSHQSFGEVAEQYGALARNLGAELRVLAAPVSRPVFGGLAYGTLLALGFLLPGLLGLGAWAAAPRRAWGRTAALGLLLVVTLGPALPVVVSTANLLGGRVLYLPSAAAAALLAALAGCRPRGGAVLLGLHGLLLGAVLLCTQGAWAASGRWTARTLEELDALHRRVGLGIPLVVVDAPEHRYGVYALRDAVAAALAPPFRPARRVVPVSLIFFRELVAAGGLRRDLEAGPVLVVRFQGGRWRHTLLGTEAARPPPVFLGPALQRWRREPGGWCSPPLGFPGAAAEGVAVYFRGVTPPVAGTFAWEGDRSGRVPFRLRRGPWFILYLGAEPDWLLARRIHRVRLRFRGAAGLLAVAFLRRLPPVEILAPPMGARFRYDGPEPVFRFRPPAGPPFDAWRLRLLHFVYSARCEGPLPAGGGGGGDPSLVPGLSVASAAADPGFLRSPGDGGLHGGAPPGGPGGGPERAAGAPLRPVRVGADEDNPSSSCLSSPRCCSPPRPPGRPGRGGGRAAREGPGGVNGRRGGGVSGRAARRLDRPPWVR